MLVLYANALLVHSCTHEGAVTNTEKDDVIYTMTFTLSVSLVVGQFT
jgi:hypothetical protein